MKGVSNLRNITLRTGFQSLLQRRGIGDLSLGEFKHNEGRRAFTKQNFIGALNLTLNRTEQISSNQTEQIEQTVFKRLMKSEVV